MNLEASRPLGSILRVLVATSLAFMVVQLDVTIVNVALPRIGVDLGTPVSGLQPSFLAVEGFWAACLMASRMRG